MRNSVQTLSEKNLVMLQDSSGIGDVMVAASRCRTIVDEADQLQLGIALNLAGCQGCTCRCTLPTACWVRPSIDQTTRR